MLDAFKEKFENMRIKTLLTGEYDSDGAILTLHAGAGGTEAMDWTSMLYRMYSRWAERHGFTVRTLDFLDGEEAGLKSVTMGNRRRERIRLFKEREGHSPSRAYFTVQCGRQAPDILCIL
jgi:peptide chain release factor 2